MNMNLYAERNGIKAAIEFGGDAGWYLFLTLPSGETRDYLQDTREIAIQRAEQDFGISSRDWEEWPALNRRWIVQHLTEALEEIQRTIEEVRNPTYREGKYVVAMSHVYHHINTAWNARFASHEEHRECSQEDFDLWRKFPREQDLLLE
jgi:hypothetical protein